MDNEACNEVADDGDEGEWVEVEVDPRPSVFDEDDE
jgi:hypothetical protein